MAKSNDKKDKTTFTPETFTVTFSDGTERDLATYNPNERCPAIRTITTRTFTVKGSGGSGGAGADFYTSEEVSVGVDTSGIENKNCKQIADQLLTKTINDNGDKLNASHIVGILANIEDESGYSPSKSVKIEGTENYAVGICQWTTGRATKMQRASGEQWMTNLKGQVDYMWIELTNGYKSRVLTPMIDSVTESTKEMAYKAMKIFCKKFKKVDDVNKAIERRKKIVDSLWKQIKITGYQGSGKKYNLTEEQVKRLVAGCIQENGSSKKAIQAEASLMCNLTEASSKYKGNVYGYVNRWHKDGGWFGDGTIKKIKGSAWKSVTKDQYRWGYEIFNGGLRTVPDYINEHDWFPNDIVWIKYGGENTAKVTGGFNKSKLKPGISIIHNNSGSTYTFWMFFRPNNGGDPYGSTYYPKRYS